MKQKIYQVDAFADQLFTGNPAAVCPLEKWLSDDLMQKIAMENNLAETAFIVRDGDQFQIRWFTPSVEVDLCGHATLAAAFVLFNYGNYTAETIRFQSAKSGTLSVTKSGEFLTLNFPADTLKKVEITGDFLSCFDIKPHSAYKGKTDYMFVFESENQVREIIPDFAKIALLDARGVIITSKGDKVDFVSRFFAPQSGITEDPVTGSAHTTLTPYWAMQLGKDELTAMQLSKRTGLLQCNNLKDRVEISGRCKLYLSGEIYID